LRGTKDGRNQRGAVWFGRDRLLVSGVEKNKTRKVKRKRNCLKRKTTTKRRKKEAIHQDNKLKEPGGKSCEKSAKKEKRGETGCTTKYIETTGLY